MAIPYPSSPTVGQTFTYGGITYTWNGVAWVYTQTNTPAVVGSVAVTAPITNTGTPTAPVIGINQSALSIAESQVTNLVSDLAGKANLAGGNSFTGAQIVETAGIANIGLVVKGTAGQSVNLLQIETASSTAISVTSAGNLNVVGQTRVGTTSGLGQLSVVSTGTATVAAVVRGASGQSVNLQEWQNSAGGTVARVDKNGAVSAQYFGPSGAGLLGYLDWTTNSPIFNTGGTGVVGLVVKGVASQSANLFSVQSNSSELAFISAAGNLNVFQQVRVGGSSGLGQLSVTSTGTATVAAVVRGVASQTADLQQWQNSGGTTLASINNGGGIRTIGSIKTTALEAVVATLAIQPAATTTIGAVVRGAASQSANLLEIQDSSASTVVAVTPTGTLRSAGLITAGSSSDVLGQLSVITTATSRIGAVIRGASGQTANLLELQRADAGVAFRVRNNGNFGSGGLVTGVNAYINNDIIGDTKGLIVRGASGQTNNLQEWQNSGGTNIATVDASGNIRGNSVRTNSDYTSLLEANSGGYVRITKQTAATPNPGANLGSLYFRDGTNAGTLKLVVRAGAAGAETTILDNIPQ